MYCKTNSVGRQHCQEGKKKSQILRVKNELNPTYFCGFSQFTENIHLCHIQDGNILTTWVGWGGGVKKRNEVNHTYIAFPELHPLNTSVWNNCQVPIARESFESYILKEAWPHLRRLFSSKRVHSWENHECKQQLGDRHSHGEPTFPRKCDTMLTVLQLLIKSFLVQLHLKNMKAKLGVTKHTSLK